MRTRDYLLSTTFAVTFLLLPAALPAQAQSALTGVVTSIEEGAMEGVVVSAKKDGSTMTVSVVTDAQGRFSFPASRLEPGYSCSKSGAKWMGVGWARASASCSCTDFYQETIS